MTTAILEIAPTAHYTYVESITKVYAAAMGNRVVIFTTEVGYQTLRHLESEAIQFVVKTEQESGAVVFRKVIALKPDRVFMVTLEPYSKALYALSKEFVGFDFGCPVYHVVHNVDFWFQRDPLSIRRNLTHQLRSFKDFVYRFKIYFYYSTIIKKLINKVKQSSGKFVVLSETIADTLRQYVDNQYIAVIPFSVFDEKAAAQPSVSNSTIRVCLPGYVSAIRRDYESIFTLLKNDAREDFKKNITWDLLGGIHPTEGGQAVVASAKSLIAAGHQIHLYEKPSVGILEFDAQLALADIVLGNLHIQQGATAAYGKSKETGMVFTLVKAAKPGLLPSDYPVEKALETSILKYKNYQELGEIILHLARNRDILIQLKKEAKRNSLKYTPLSIFNKLENELSKPCY